ncbi:MAG: hypothetical protein H6556_05595 [Lewinellaceae bacterium]|nr:hypothetical protein [Lewinellaceae bacterium]
MKKHWGLWYCISPRPPSGKIVILMEGRVPPAMPGAAPTHFLSTEVLGVNLGFNKPFGPKVVGIRP